MVFQYDNHLKSKKITMYGGRDLKYSWNLCFFLQLAYIQAIRMIYAFIIIMKCFKLDANKVVF